jgi:hypothetical protein
VGDHVRCAGHSTWQGTHYRLMQSGILLEAVRGSTDRHGQLSVLTKDEVGLGLT